MRFLHLLVFAVSATALLAAVPGRAGDARPTHALSGPSGTPAAYGDVVAILPAPAPPVAGAGPAKPMAAWAVFCRNYPAECRIDLSEADTIRLTPAVWRDIAFVNRDVNGLVRPITDLEHWGQIDRWDLAEDGWGDCEDYQLLKRQRLAELGLPRRAMPMTVVLDERNEGHAVLMLRTDRGDFILDNKRNEILPWQRTGYVFVKRESQTEIGWTSLNHVSGVTATAAR